MGYSLAQLCEAGIVAGLSKAGMTVQDLKAAGFTMAQLREAGCTPQMLRTANFSAKQIASEGGYTLKELMEGGYTQNGIDDLNTLANMDFSDKDMAEAGFEEQEIFKW